MALVRFSRAHIMGQTGSAADLATGEMEMSTGMDRAVPIAPLHPLPSTVEPVLIPQASGPVPITAGSAPYTGWGVGMLASSADAPDHDEPGERGYTTEEYIISGTVDGGAYRTTLLIRRP